MHRSTNFRRPLAAISATAVAIVVIVTGGQSPASVAAFSNSGNSFDGRSASSLNSAVGDQLFTGEASFDEEAYNRKNFARKKFGLKSLTPEEYIEIQIQTKQLEADQNARHIQQVEEASISQQKSEMNFFGELSKMVENVMEDTCESNYDCERPQVCCDLGFKKMCCSSGKGVLGFQDQQQLQMIPLRVIAD